MTILARGAAWGFFGERRRPHFGSDDQVLRVVDGDACGNPELVLSGFIGLGERDRLDHGN